MNEITDAILNGDFCELCGEWMGEMGCGIPRCCESCYDGEEVKQANVVQ